MLATPRFPDLGHLSRLGVSALGLPAHWWSEERKAVASGPLILVLLWRQTVGIIHNWEGGREGDEASWITLCPPRSDDDPPCNLNHFHLASQGSKELVNITSWPCVSFSQLHFQLRAEEKREPSVHSVKKQEEGWEVGWCMKNIIGEKRTEVVNSWRRHYFGASIADNGCRSGKIPTPGEKGLSELLFLCVYTQDLCLPWLLKAYTFWLVK